MPFLAALPGLALGGLKIVGRWLTSRSIIELACIALAIFAAVQTIRVSSERRHSQKVETQLRKCSDARKTDRESYERAQREAQERNRAHVERVERQQEQVTKDVASKYQADLARLRAELAIRLRQSPPGSAGGSQVSPVPGAPQGIIEAPSVCIPTSQYVQGAEVELQLDALIDWVEQQMKVR